MDVAAENTAELVASASQLQGFHEARAMRSQRSQLHILVVEDQLFSQKLLCEILQDSRLRNNNETPLIDTVRGIHEGWHVYLKKAPNMVFVDLGLSDGSGHTLARSVRTIDPDAFIVIVTAKNYEEEFGIARQNHVDGFIAKPYDKKHILTYVDRYITVSGIGTKGSHNARTRRPR